MNAELIEKKIFDKFSKKQTFNPYFILGSPRTGSTFLYQLILNLYKWAYFSNYINDNFYTHPCVGFKLLWGLDYVIDYESSYGKTCGIQGPSEASNIMKTWFGGAHPSQIKSRSFISLDHKKHMINSINAIQNISNKNILIKNAWNCFRIECLAKSFPNARFIWIRRSIINSACSDLNSRIKHGGAHSWNSATPANYLEIKKLPPACQVVEQQYEYNKTIMNDLDKYAPSKYIEIWYEDLQNSLETTINDIDYFTGLQSSKCQVAFRKKQTIVNEDIASYVKTIYSRVKGCRYKYV